MALTSACLAVVWVGGAASAPGPSAAGMALGLSDFPRGATLASEKSSPLAYLPRIPYCSAFTRSFSSVIADHVRIASLASSVIVTGSQAAATPFMRTLSEGVGSTLARAAMLAIFRREIGAELAREHVTIGSAGLLRARELAAGRAAVEFVFFVTTSAAGIVVGEIYVQEEDALGVVFYVTGAPGVPAAEDLSLARLLASRVEEASWPPPVDSAPPAIGGTLRPGAVLTASPGRWSRVVPSTSYSYRWYLCTPAGQGCAAIAGASAPTYIVRDADAGETVAVSVTATAPAGSTTAMSSASGVIASELRPSAGPRPGAGDLV